MNAPTFRIPESAAGDSSDVAVALEVASALWDKGEVEEAIRWLRRAVTSASDADDAVRAAALAGAAADIEEEMKRRLGAINEAAGTPVALTPDQAAPLTAEYAAPAAPEDPASAATEHPQPTAAEHEESPRAQHASAIADQGRPIPREVEAALPLGNSEETHSVAPVASAVGPFIDAAVAASTDSAAAPVLSARAAVDVAASIVAPAIGAPPSPSIAPGPVTGAPSPRAPSSPAATGNTSALAAPRASISAAPRSNFAKPPTLGLTHALVTPPALPTRLRVSVKSSVRDAGLLFVRALAEGETAPPGTLEAFLVRPEGEIDAKRNVNGGAEE